MGLGLGLWGGDLDGGEVVWLRGLVAGWSEWLLLLLLLLLPLLWQLLLKGWWCGGGGCRGDGREADEIVEVGSLDA